MDKQSSNIIINYSKCLPCATLICAGVCPVGIIEQGKKQKPVITDISSCTKCGVCLNLCPSKAISIKQQKQTNEK